MKRTLLTFALFALATGGVGLAEHDQHRKGAAKVLLQKELVEKLDAKKGTATMVEVTLGPGESDAPHRHPGSAIGYILEGEYEWAIDDNKPKILKVGDSFFEPAGCLHRVSKNPSKKGNTRFLAVVLHPSDAKDLVIPEKGKK